MAAAPKRLVETFLAGLRARAGRGRAEHRVMARPTPWATIRKGGRFASRHAMIMRGRRHKVLQLYGFSAVGWMKIVL